MTEQLNTTSGAGWVRDMRNTLKEIEPILIDAIQDLPAEADRETKAMIGGVAKLCHFKVKQVNDYHNEIKSRNASNQPNDTREYWRKGWDKRRFNGYPHDIVSATLGCLLATASMLEQTTSNDDFQVSETNTSYALVVMVEYVELLRSILSSIDYQTTAAA